VRINTSLKWVILVATNGGKWVLRGVGNLFTRVRGIGILGRSSAAFGTHI
jgi:hypothetical protein